VASLVDYLRRLKRGAEGKPTQKQLEFTSREREIISLIITGCVNKEIAAKLTLSEDTVKHHLSNIFAKAKVANRLELAIWAMNQGFP